MVGIAGKIQDHLSIGGDVQSEASTVRSQVEEESSRPATDADVALQGAEELLLPVENPVHPARELVGQGRSSTDRQGRSH